MVIRIGPSLRYSTTPSLPTGSFLQRRAVDFVVAFAEEAEDHLRRGPAFHQEPPHGVDRRIGWEQHHGCGDVAQAPHRDKRPIRLPLRRGKPVPVRTDCIDVRPVVLPELLDAGLALEVPVEIFLQVVDVVLRQAVDRLRLGIGLQLLEALGDRGDVGMLLLRLIAIGVVAVADDLDDIRLREELPTARLIRTTEPFDGMIYFFSMVDPINRFCEHTCTFHILFSQDEETLLVINFAYKRSVGL